MATTSPSVPRNAATVAAYAIGRGAGTVGALGSGCSAGARAASNGAVRVAPLVGGMAIAALSGVYYGLANVAKWRRGEMTGEEAARDTACESIGTGVATGVGLAAANFAAGAALAASTVAVVPFLAGAAATTAAKSAWDRALRRLCAPAVPRRRSEGNPSRAMVNRFLPTSSGSPTIGQEGDVSESLQQAATPSVTSQ